MLHTQIANAVASSITLGHFRTGDRLPPERELAKEFGVNRLTVRQALAELQLRKLIHRRTGRNGGTFIAEPVIEYDLTTFAGFSEQARRLGHIAGAQSPAHRTRRGRRRDRRGAATVRRRRGLRDRSTAFRQRPAGLAGALELPGRTIRRSAERAAPRLDLRTPRTSLRRSTGARRRTNLADRRQRQDRSPARRHARHATAARRTRGVRRERRTGRERV